MVMQADEIVDIPKNRVKFFGTTGKMLLPSPATIATAIQQVPESKVITTVALRQHLSQQFNVEGTCPVTMKKALVAIANDPNSDVAYWRVINQNGGLISNFKEQAHHLQHEGVIVTANQKVENFKDKLFTPIMDKAIT